MNRGILAATDCFHGIRLSVRDLLPEDHRIVAERRTAGPPSWTEYLIEGPSMPAPLADGAPAPVDILWKRSYPQDGNPIKLSACWTHAQDEWWALSKLPFDQLE
jgi:hypothetical protein